MLAFMEVSWLERSAEGETDTVTESSDGVASYVLLSVRAPGSMFGVQVAGDEDVILVPEELAGEDPAEVRVFSVVDKLRSL
ncbi:hypothetical protein TNCT_421301 [Trichonephila clavata]|uniref:Uncharacterized protein n=1 Tax=Trichonephila clavata TaxID=2740835 RepID=A0A8X6IJC6_TRICU|nr:hypothetical protein TNCT_421301 [Trichonephila clavata]